MLGGLETTNIQTESVILALVEENFATDFSEVGFPSGCLKTTELLQWEEATCQLDMSLRHVVQQHFCDRFQIVQLVLPVSDS